MRGIQTLGLPELPAYPELPPRGPGAIPQGLRLPQGGIQVTWTPQNTAMIATTTITP